MWGTNEFRAAALRFERALRLFRVADPREAPDDPQAAEAVDGHRLEPAGPPAGEDERQAKIDDLLRQAAATDDLARRSALITEAVRLHMVAGADDGDSGLDDDEP
jgi:hypothetical protein